MPERRELDRDRFRGSLVGLAVGDALGTTVEFSAPGTFTPVTDMVGGGPFALPAGAWTDDTSMALCLAESLVETGAFDPIDQLNRYVRWYRQGHWSSTGEFFDIGNSTRSALQRFERTGEPFPGDADPNGAGNGPLMRLAPIPLAYATNRTNAVQRAAESARTTHGAPQAIDATRYLAWLIVGALHGESIQELLACDPTSEFGAVHPEVKQIIDGSFKQKEPPEIRGTGYSVRALEAALWALNKFPSFEAGVLAAVNLGDDADTTAAIYGQLAGAAHGLQAIPERWRNQLVMYDEIIELADRLYDLAHAVPEDAKA